VCVRYFKKETFYRFNFIKLFLQFQVLQNAICLKKHGKGMVPTKKKILSFTRLQVVSNLYEYLCSAEHKRRYFEEYVICIWLPKFFQISSFVFSRTKKFLQVWNNMRCLNYYNFWVNYPFNIMLVFNNFEMCHLKSSLMYNEFECLCGQY